LLDCGKIKVIPSLDGLRAISVSLVLIGHLARSGHTPDVLRVYAASGVRMFFVNSGCLMTTILLNEHARTSGINLREFYIRRAYRIIPAPAVFNAVCHGGVLARAAMDSHRRHVSVPRELRRGCAVDGGTSHPSETVALLPIAPICFIFL